MFELRVLSGLHCGAALPLSGDLWQIGASPQADLLLSDESAADSERWLRRHEQNWWLAQQAEAEEGEPVTPEEPFVLGGVWLCVARASTPWHEAAALPASAFVAPAAAPEAPVARASG
ncbi:FHA domain-containing protein, partial [Enterobacter hormaechei]